jgi:hypothetical protein
MTKWAIIGVLLLTVISYSAYESGYNKGSAEMVDKFYYTLKRGEYVQLSDIMVRPQDVTYVAPNAIREDLCDICHISGTMQGSPVPQNYGDNARKSTQEANNG